MVDVIEQIIVNKSRDLVFLLAQDYDLRLDWDPFLKDISFVSENNDLARGLQVWVKAHNNMEMTVEYTNYKYPEHVSMKMINGPFIFKKFSGLWQFDEIDDQTTCVLFKYSITPILILKPGSLIIKWILSRDMRKRLKALKESIESGEFDEELMNI